MKKAILATATILAISTSVQAQENKVIYDAGDWKTTLTVDAMTDATYCTSWYKKNPQVQVTPSTFYYDQYGKGGVSGYRYRLDDNEASAFQLATHMEKEISTIIIPLESVSNAKRLRIQGISILDTTISADIDLTGMKKAVDSCTAKTASN